MEFKNEQQRVCFERVSEFVRDTFGPAATQAEGLPMFSVMIGSAVTVVSVLPHREDEAIVATRAVVVSEPVLTPDLSAFLLRANSSMMFAAFGLTPRGDVVLQHNMIGSTIDAEELRASIVTVAQVADEFDDLIVSRWGGQRALDKIDSYARLLEADPPGRSH